MWHAALAAACCCLLTLILMYASVKPVRLLAAGAYNGLLDHVTGTVVCSNGAAAAMTAHVLHGRVFVPRLCLPLHAAEKLLHEHAFPLPGIK